MRTCKICLQKFTKIKYDTERIAVCGRCIDALNNYKEVAQASYKEAGERLKRGMKKRLERECQPHQSERIRINALMSLERFDDEYDFELRKWLNKLTADSQQQSKMHKLMRAERRGLLHNNQPRGYAYPSNWSEVARRIRVLDDYTCICCRAQNVELHVHHLVYVSNFGTHRKQNLVTLCKKCHEKEHQREFDFGESKNGFDEVPDPVALAPLVKPAPTVKAAPLVKPAPTVKPAPPVAPAPPVKAAPPIKVVPPVNKDAGQDIYERKGSFSTTGAILVFIVGVIIVSSMIASLNKKGTYEYILTETTAASITDVIGTENSEPETNIVLMEPLADDGADFIKKAAASIVAATSTEIRELDTDNVLMESLTDEGVDSKEKANGSTMLAEIPDIRNGLHRIKVRTQYGPPRHVRINNNSVEWLYKSFRVKFSSSNLVIGVYSLNGSDN